MYGVTVPTAMGQGLSAPQSRGFLLCMCTPFDAELTNFMWYHTWEKGLFLSGQPSSPQGAGSQRSPILGFFSIYAYTYVAELPNLRW